MEGKRDGSGNLKTERRERRNESGRREAISEML